MSHIYPGLGKMAEALKRVRAQRAAEAARRLKVADCAYEQVARAVEAALDRLDRLKAAYQRRRAVPTSTWLKFNAQALLQIAPLVDELQQANGRCARLRQQLDLCRCGMCGHVWRAR